jgi:membrane protease YdiL (CAAX protease family)
METPAANRDVVQQASRISSITLWKAFLWFALPGLAMLVGIQWLNPLLVANGVPLIGSFLMLLYAPILVVGLAALVAYRREGHPWTWRAFANRMRLTRMRRQDWLWALGGLLVVMVGEVILEPSTRWLAGIPLFVPPPSLPALVDPFQPLALPPTEFMGQTLLGNWWVAAVYAIALFVNIAGEEIAWRGYLLPRQERTHGRWAWLVNGLLWIFVLHAVLRWVYIGLLPTGLLTPYIAQRTQNTWPAVIIHGAGNFVFLIFVVMGVLGIGT